MTRFQKIIKYFAIALALSIILGVFGGALTGLRAISRLNRLTSDEEGKTEEIEDIDALKRVHIEVRATNVKIVEGEKLSCVTDNKYISIKERMGTYLIEEERHSLVNKTSALDEIVEITLPKGVTLDRIDISAGAGTVNADVLRAKRVSLSIGAGDVVIENIISTEKTEINGGIGKFILKSGSVNNLDFNVGVGKAEITAKITGESEIDGGVGAFDLCLLGEERDYTLEIDKGFGETSFKGKQLDASAEFGKGENEIEISGGVGEMSVYFGK